MRIESDSKTYMHVDCCHNHGIFLTIGIHSSDREARYIALDEAQTMEFLIGLSKELKIIFSKAPEKLENLILSDDAKTGSFRTTEVIQPKNNPT